MRIIRTKKQPKDKRGHVLEHRTAICIWGRDAQERGWNSEDMRHDYTDIAVLLGQGGWGDVKRMIQQEARQCWWDGFYDAQLDKERLHR